MASVISLAIVGVWATVWTGFAALALARARACARRRSPEVTVSPSMRTLIVRPCAGLERALATTLASTEAAARRLGPGTRVRFCTARVDDPAASVAIGAAASLAAQGLDAAWVLARTAAANEKAGQLAVVVDGDADHDVVVVVDSDVDLADFDPRPLVARIEAGYDVVWCAPTEHALNGTFADRASAAVLAGSLHAFVVLRGIDPSGLVGKVFAVSSRALRSIGGFAAFTDRLGEDVAIAQGVRARGGCIDVEAQVVRSLACGRSLAAVVARYVRWLVVVRSQRPWLLPSYPLLVAASPLIVVTAAIVGGTFGLGTSVAIALLRIAIAAAVGRLAGRTLSLRRAVFDATIADALLLLAWSRALVARRVAWRERSLVVRPGGRVEPPRHPPREQSLGHAP